MEDKTPLNEEEVAQALRTLPGWRVEGKELCKDYRFENFQQINRFLPRLAATIVEQNHHPDFVFAPGEKRLSIRTTTHSTGGLTQADLDLARALEREARS
ncbi:MAG: 4a-hydroxytetrahydrobiopterin dehydratase [Candidatus Hydrogenedentota bacterium]|nr:MAG: 4a-hydroxytetrahydrobiopterin dehydratase [Candidatus Hydrogenedentota bacterium]